MKKGVKYMNLILRLKQAHYIAKVKKWKYLFELNEERHMLFYPSQDENYLKR